MMSDYTPTTEEVRDAFAIRKWDNFQRNYPNSHDKTERDAERERFDRWLAQVKAEAWDEAYRQGIEDERTAEELQVGIGLGGYAPANRSNPHREEDQR